MSAIRCELTGSLTEKFWRCPAEEKEDGISWWLVLEQGGCSLQCQSCYYLESLFVLYLLDEQEGVERLASSTLQCHLSLVLIPDFIPQRC